MGCITSSIDPIEVTIVGCIISYLKRINWVLEVVIVSSPLLTQLVVGLVVFPFLGWGNSLSP